MNNWKIVSFYSNNYADIAYKYLIPSLKKLNLDYYIVEIPNLNSWKEATDYKAWFIKECLNKFTCNIVWIDADATVNSYPILFDELSDSNIDVAYHMLSWETHYGRPRDKGKFEFLSGTLFFNNNIRVKQLIDQWIVYTKIYSPEQRALRQAIREAIGLNIKELPREYCYIMTKPDGSLSAIPLENTIINHYQASRGKKH